MNQEEARSILLEHARSSKNGQFPEEFCFSGKLTNPLCGDHVELRIKTEGHEIRDIGYKAVACAICSASASLLCQEARGRGISEVIDFSYLFEASVVEAEDVPWPSQIQGLDCFSHLRINPSRRMCALLPWVTLRSALKKEN